MFTKSILTATAAAVALAAPVGAFASSLNDGHEMQAAILSLDASQFTTNELAQISAERNDADKAVRAAYILDQKGRAVVTTSGAANLDAVSSSDRGEGRETLISVIRGENSPVSGNVASNGVKTGLDFNGSDRL